MAWSFAYQNLMNSVRTKASSDTKLWGIFHNRNGVTKWMNRTILERTRCMLLNTDLSKKLWAEAVATVAYLINRSPSSVINNKTPKEVWSDHPPDYSSLKIFGCSTYAYVNQGKLEPKSIKCIFVSYASGVKRIMIVMFKSKITQINYWEKCHI